MTYFKRVLVLMLLGLPLLACADDAVPAAPEYKEGVNYAVLEEPVRTRDASKIEVVEVFWYGCIHCSHFDPLVTNWKKTLSNDVDFWLSPAMWNQAMETHARIFYTADRLGIEPKVHTALFTALLEERKPMVEPQQIEDFFADFGVDRDKFRKIFNSFGVSSLVKQANARARGYRITGTPELVINGKYRIDAKMAGGQPEMLKVADFLIAKERAARARQ